MGECADSVVSAHSGCLLDAPDAPDDPDDPDDLDDPYDPEEMEEFPLATSLRGRVSRPSVTG